MARKEKIINYAMTKKIKDLVAGGASVINVIGDILAFENIDVYDILDQIPESLIKVIRKELAKKNYHIAEKEFPELRNVELEDDAF